MKEKWDMLMDRYKKAEEYFSNPDVPCEEKLEFEDDLHNLLDEISVESIKRSETKRQLSCFTA